MNPKITYGITVCNESWQLRYLLSVLYPYIQDGDQVLIQSDSDNVTPDVLEVIEQFIKQYDGSHFKTVHQSVPLAGDFGAFKNKLKGSATGDWIFQIDADEYPTPSLMTSLLYVLRENDHVDVILVPRINTVSGITQEHVGKWGWNISVIHHPLLRDNASLAGIPKGYLDLLQNSDAVHTLTEAEVGFYRPVINFPDYQYRLYKNDPKIKWVNKVHERLVGFNTYATLPTDISWCLMHEKEIDRQELQNKFYEGIIHGTK
jgi:hypothetical protein